MSANLSKTFLLCQAVKLTISNSDSFDTGSFHWAFDSGVPNSFQQLLLELLILDWPCMNSKLLIKHHEWLFIDSVATM
jgi:hypothetical protein